LRFASQFFEGFDFTGKTGQAIFLLYFQRPNRTAGPILPLIFT
jgi:hypothetical protein